MQRPYSIFFDSAIGRLNVVGNSLDNHLYESISNTGYLELTLDENHFSSDPSSQYFYASITGATKDTLTGINFDGGDGRDSLFIGDQTVKSLSIQTEDDLIISGNIFTDFLTTNADNLTVKNSNITASENNKGGSIQLLGNRVEVLNSNLNASGNLSGGSILIGGDYQGKGQVQNAQTTFVSKDSTIQANALQSGNGGKVIIWADGDTDFRGDIKARGGAKSGDGGFVEVSGKQNLNFVGDVDVDAPNGKQGTVLLDPADIIINADDGDKATFDISDLYKLKGNINLSASNSIVFNVGAYFNKAQGTISLQAGGAVNLFGDFLTTSSNINISAGSITAEGKISGVFGKTSKNISLTSRGDIQTNGIYGLNINIVAGGSITTEQINGNDGNISLTASLGIKIGGISSFSQFNQAGNITINTPDVFEVYSIGDYAFGEPNKGDIFTFSTYGSGGNLTINAKKFISSGNIYANTYSGQGKGGNVTIKADEVKVGLINTGTNGSGNGGNIRIETTDDIGVTNIITTSVTGNAGSVTLNASGDILTSYIDGSSQVSGNGGTVRLTSEAGKINTNGQRINTSAINGNAGKVILNAVGDITSGSISTYSNSMNAGNIQVISTEGNIDLGQNGVQANSKQGNGANITLIANSITTGLIDSGADGNGSGGNIKLSTKGDILTSTIVTNSNGSGQSGNISLTSTNGNINTTNASPDTTARQIYTGANTGNAGSITVNAYQDILINEIYASSRSGDGNNISLTSVNGGINTGVISTTSLGGNAGKITGV